MDDSGNVISRLRTGEAVVFFRGLAEPLKIITEDIRKKENIRLSVSDEEIKSRIHYWEEHRNLLIPYSECSLYPLCSCCNQKIREEARYYSNRYYNEGNTDIESKKDVFMALCGLGNWLAEKKDVQSSPDKALLFNCIRIQFIKSLMTEKDIDLDCEFVRNTLKTCHYEVDIKLGYYEE